MALYGIHQFAGNIGSLAAALAADNEIMGLENLNDEQIAGLLGSIEGLGAPAGAKNNARKKVAKAMSRKSNNITRETKDLTGKALFEQRIAQVAPDVRQKLESGQWQLVPFVYYSVKNIGGINHIDMFESGDQTLKGISNIVQGRLPAEDFFMCSAIRVTTAADVTDQIAALNAKYGSPCAQVVNGEWMCGLESVTYVDKCAASVFDHENVTTMANGIYVLDTPKMMNPQRRIRLEFDMVGTVPANTWMRAELIGIKTAKA